MAQFEHPESVDVLHSLQSGHEVLHDVANENLQVLLENKGHTV